jgi:hypothetical protein
LTFKSDREGGESRMVRRDPLGERQAKVSRDVRVSYQRVYLLGLKRFGVGERVL